MKKLIYLALILSLFLNCGPKQEKVERFMENGVEVVLNHIEPYKIKSEPGNLTLIEDFSIDTEDPKFAEKGLTDIVQFDIDSSGDVYFLVPSSGAGTFIHKYHRGEFKTSFGRKGQGPGELQWPYAFRVNKQDEVMIAESDKLFFYDKEGTFLSQTVVPKINEPEPLREGKYLALITKFFDRSKKYNPLFLSLFTSDFKEIKELDRFNLMPNKLVFESVSDRYYSAIGYVFMGRATSEYIYTGNSERGYEILVYDMEGNLVRKIKKEYRPVEVSENYKKEYMKPYEISGDSFAKAWSEKIYFPQYWHPFNSFFPDEEGRLYVMTYEKGFKEREFMFDIFSPDGVFIARKSLNIWRTEGGLDRQVHAKCQNQRLYVIQEKESGYKKLMVYKMNWQ